MQETHMGAQTSEPLVLTPSLRRKHRCVTPRRPGCRQTNHQAEARRTLTPQRAARRQTDRQRGGGGGEPDTAAGVCIYIKAHARHASNTRRAADEQRRRDKQP
ncbi:unnamed protein product [Gadus morhua 'NCC']